MSKWLSTEIAISPEVKAAMRFCVAIVSTFLSAWLFVHKINLLGSIFALVGLANFLHVWQIWRDQRSSGGGT